MQWEVPAVVGLNGSEVVDAGLVTGTVDLAETTLPAQVGSLGGKSRNVIDPVGALPPAKVAVSVSVPFPAWTLGEATVVRVGVTSVNWTVSSPHPPVPDL